MERSHDISPETGGRRKRTIALLSALVLIFPAVSYAILGDAPLIPLLTASLLVGALLIPRSLPDTTRSVVYTVTGSLLVTVILNQAYKVDGDRFFMPLPTEVVLPFFLGCGIGFCYMRQNMRTLGAIVLFSFMAFLLQGTCLNDPTSNLRLPLPNNLWRNRYVIFGLFSMLTLLTAIPLFFHALPRRLHEKLPDMAWRGRRLWYALSIILVVALSALFGVVVPPLVDGLDRWMNPFLSRYVRMASSPGLFNDSVSLTQTVFMKNPMQQNRLVFQVQSRTVPGYMRGRVFITYQDARWNALPPSEPAESLPVNEDLAVSRFALDTTLRVGDDAAALDRMDIYTTPAYRTDVLFAPGNTQIVETIADYLLTNVHGTASPREWIEAGGYTLFSSQFDPFGAWNQPHLRGDAWQAYLEVPENIAEEIAAFNQQVFITMPGNPFADMTRVSLFLQNHATYELGVPLNGQRDPVLQFLNELRRGHCELFASAAVMLLRQRGIPARYVTGFVVMEQSGKHAWTARLGQAHAWVEAYDVTAGEWHLVEATPAVGIPQGDEQTTFLSSLRETLALRWAAFFALIKRGYFAGAVLTLFRDAWDGTRWIMWTGPWYVGWPLLLLGLWWVYRKLPHRRQRHAPPLPDRIQRLHEVLRLIDRELARLRISRQPQTSIRDLIRSISTEHPEAAARLVPMLDEYERLRYQQELPEPAAIEYFSSRVKEALRAGSAWKMNPQESSS